jgi:hypothetical protein
MNVAIHAAAIAELEAAETTAALAKWCADHSSIRHPWAIENPIALKVRVALEPTSDGDDILLV